MKKWLKIWLIVWWSILIAWWAWAGLTKTWIIPNWLDIEILCPGTSSDFTRFWNYDRTDPNCSEKCHKQCKKHENEPFWYLCWNNCISDCEIPKRNDCLNKCELPNISEELQSHYTKEEYHNRCEQIYSGFNDCYSWWPDNSLANEQHYLEWINENFNWNQEELKKYEACKSSCGADPGWMMAMKPIIYLYPTTESEVNVKLWAPENLSHTYPKYNISKWRNVFAKPNWNLKDINTWRNLYALYREWKSNIKSNFNEWFIVKWKDIITFLEEKLAILWLNEHEAEEFIIYWLPQMENNKYNLIRFETIEEQNKNMPLNITPTPDTVIRVMMDWQAIDEAIEIPEQKLITPERNWFTVVEWWGSPRN